MSSISEVILSVEMISWDKVSSIAAVEVVGGTKAWVWLGVVETAGVVA